jgi:NADH:ubiquinone oxidoreductase subunit F (NADH-binding)/NADH:ubiquinone oxidoreductase subunit E
MRTDPVKKLVPELIKLQKRRGYLDKDDMRELARKLFDDRDPDGGVDLPDGENIPEYRLYQVASFFNHFRFKAPPKVDIHVCRDLSCYMAGAMKFTQELDKLSKEIGGEQVHVDGCSCLGRCDQPVAWSINDRYLAGTSIDQAISIVQNAQEGKLPSHQRFDAPSTPWNIDPYAGGGRFEAVKKVLGDLKACGGDDNRLSAARQAIVKTLEDATLKGKGGPGEGTSGKWQKVITSRPGVERYVVCNADESEPGTFKDREILLHLANLVVEGVMIACLTIGAKRGYIYIRHEYPEQEAALESAIEEARSMGLLSDSNFPLGVEVFVSPGNYICGEQTALIEVIEGKRAEPRQRPPDLTVKGLFGVPTLINNVETLAWVPSILHKGADWYKSLGVNGCTGMRLVSLSGDIRKPGVYEVPLGATVRDLLERVGGMTRGEELKAFAPSGPSGGYLPAKLRRDRCDDAMIKVLFTPDQQEYDILDLKLDNGQFRKIDQVLGAAHVFYGSSRNMFDQAINATQFYRDESCGKCVPCRVGTEKLVEMARTGFVDGQQASTIQSIEVLSFVMNEASICGLGQVASNPLRTVISYFPLDLKSAPAADTRR